MAAERGFVFGMVLPETMAVLREPCIWLCVRLARRCSDVAAGGADRLRSVTSPEERGMHDEDVELV